MVSVPASLAQAPFLRSKVPRSLRVHTSESMKTIQFITTLCATALITTATAQDVRGKLQELEQQARAAKEAGRADEAQSIVEKIHRIKAEHQEGDGEKQDSAKRKAEKGDEAEQRERRNRDNGEKRPNGDIGKKEKGADDRRQHIGEAIRHLRAAGLNEPARDLENLVHEHDKMGKEEGSQRALRDTQEQTHRALRDTQEQMKKMAHAIEELREQVKKLEQK